MWKIQEENNCNLINISLDPFGTDKKRERHRLDIKSKDKK